MKEIIMKILSEIKPEQNFEDYENFVEEGILDSFDIIELISSIEEYFEIVIDGLDIVPDNFSNIEQIELLIKKSGYRA